VGHCALHQLQPCELVPRLLHLHPARHSLQHLLPRFLYLVAAGVPVCPDQVLGLPQLLLVLTTEGKLWPFQATQVLHSLAEWLLAASLQPVEALEEEPGDLQHEDCKVS